jgi:thiamine biosynthesis lipoprotein
MIETRCQPSLGTYVEVTTDAGHACEAAFAAVAQVHALMSAHDPDSELSRINRLASRKAVSLHPWTVMVLRRALFWAALSDGLFDPAVGAIMRRRGLIPRHAGHAAPVHAAGWRDIRLEADRIWFNRPVMLDLGGIAKGFAVDVAVAAMQAAGAGAGLVNAGGDMAAFGPVRWPVTIADPFTRQPVAAIELFEGAVATSAVHCGGGRIDARHLPLRQPGSLSATVKARCAMDSDALAKIVLAGGDRVAACLAAGGAVALRQGADGCIDSLEPAAA